jgi:O-antigen/teichoic acid export membrane protein
MGAVASYGWLLDFGIGGAVVKYVAEHHARAEREAARVVVGSALLVSLGLASATILLTLALAPLIPTLLNLSADQRSLVVMLTALVGLDVAVTIAFSPRTAILRGLQRYDLHNGVQMFGATLQAIVTIAVLKSGGGVLTLIASNIPVNLVMRLANTAVVNRVAPELNTGIRSAERPVVRRLLSYCYSAFTIDVAGRLQSKTDEFVIALYQPLSAITPYVLARRLSELTSLAATQCVKVVMPLASELEATDRLRKLRKLHIVASRIALATAMPVALVLALSGGAILALWVGPAYAEGSSLIVVLAAASLITASQWPATEILQGITRHHVVAWTTFLAGMANVALSIALLPVMGLMGVALGTLIPTAVGSLLVVMPFTNRTLNVSWRRAATEIWIPGLAPAIPAGLVLSALHRYAEPGTMLTMIAWSAVTAIVYGIGFLSMPGTAAERALIRDLMTSSSRSLRRVLVNVYPLRAR